MVEITSGRRGHGLVERSRGGIHPCEVEIVHYGTYDVRLAKPGYELISTGRSASAPVWICWPRSRGGAIPADFTSRSSWSFTLAVEDMSTDAVVERAIVAEIVWWR